MPFVSERAHSARSRKVKFLVYVRFTLKRRHRGVKRQAQAQFIARGLPPPTGRYARHGVLTGNPKIEYRHHKNRPVVSVFNRLSLDHIFSFFSVRWSSASNLQIIPSLRMFSQLFFFPYLLQVLCVSSHLISLIV